MVFSRTKVDLGAVMSLYLQELTISGKVCAVYCNQITPTKICTANSILVLLLFLAAVKL